jgi:hypothetical protein
VQRSGAALACFIAPNFHVCHCRNNFALSPSSAHQSPNDHLIDSAREAFISKKIDVALKAFLFYLFKKFLADSALRIIKFSDCLLQCLSFITPAAPSALQQDALVLRRCH